MALNKVEFAPQPNRNHLLVNDNGHSVVICAECLEATVIGEDYNLYKRGADAPCEFCAVTKDKN